MRAVLLNLAAVCGTCVWVVLGTLTLIYLSVLIPWLRPLIGLMLNRRWAGDSDVLPSIGPVTTRGSLFVAISETARAVFLALAGEPVQAITPAIAAAVWWLLWWRSGGGRGKGKRIRAALARVAARGARLVTVAVPAPAPSS